MTTVVCFSVSNSGKWGVRVDFPTSMFVFIFVLLFVFIHYCVFLVNLRCLAYFLHWSNKTYHVLVVVRVVCLSKLDAFCGQPSNIQSGKVGPAPGIFEFPKGSLK